MPSGVVSSSGAVSVVSVAPEVSGGEWCDVARYRPQSTNENGRLTEPPVIHSIA
jgi:hypothetical protein